VWRDGIFNPALNCPQLVVGERRCDVSAFRMAWAATWKLRRVFNWIMSNHWMEKCTSTLQQWLNYLFVVIKVDNMLPGCSSRWYDDYCVEFKLCCVRLLMLTSTHCSTETDRSFTDSIAIPTCECLPLCTIFLSPFCLFKWTWASLVLHNIVWMINNNNNNNNNNNRQ